MMHLRDMYVLVSNPSLTVQEAYNEPFGGVVYEMDLVPCTFSIVTYILYGIFVT